MKILILIINFTYLSVFFAAEKLAIPKGISARVLIAQLLNEGKLKKKGSRLECPFCENTLATRETLTNHLRMHLNEKKYKCEKCGDRFIQKHHLTSHQRTNFSCSRKIKKKQKGDSEKKEIVEKNEILDKNTEEKPVVLNYGVDTFTPQHQDTSIQLAEDQIQQGLELAAPSPIPPPTTLYLPQFNEPDSVEHNDNQTIDQCTPLFIKQDESHDPLINDYLVNDDTELF